MDIMNNNRQRSKWKLVGAVALTIAVAGVTAYVVTKKGSEVSKKNEKPKRKPKTKK